MVWVGEEYVVEPNGWVNERYVDPAFSLLPVQPPKVNPLSLPRPKDYLKPVGHKLHCKQWLRKCTLHNIIHKGIPLYQRGQMAHTSVSVYMHAYY